MSPTRSPSRSRSTTGDLATRVRVAPDDMGKVIGRGGRTAKAIRTVVRAAAQREGHGAMVDIED